MKRQFSPVTYLLAAVLIAGCGGRGGDDQGKVSGTNPVVKGVGLETVKVAQVPETMEVAGTVHSRTSAIVSARVPGVITVLKVREGDRVRKGQLLAQLDAQENLAAAAGASAGIDEARRGLEEAVSRQQLAESTFGRYQKLFEEQAISRQEYDVKQTEKNLANQGVARAEARLKQAREGSRSADAIAGYTRITAPIAGIITSRKGDPGTTLFPGQPLFTIEDEGSYLLELAIPESMARSVTTGASVQVTLDVVAATCNSTIAEIVPAADQGSRTFIAKVPLAVKGVRSGMFGRGVIGLGTTVKGIMVPKQALVERGALTSVWVVTKGEIVRMRLVKAGKMVGDRVEILSGLSDGDRVVVTGVEKVTEGARVE